MDKEINITKIVEICTYALKSTCKSGTIKKRRNTLQISKNNSKFIQLLIKITPIPNIQSVSKHDFNIVTTETKSDCRF